MGKTCSIIIGLALVLGQTAIASAEGLRPSAMRRVTWYLKAGLQPCRHIWFEEYGVQRLPVLPQGHQELGAVRPWRRLSVQFYFRFDVTGEYRGTFGLLRPGTAFRAATARSTATSSILILEDSIPAPTNTRLISRAGSAFPTAMSTSAHGGHHALCRRRFAGRGGSG